MIHETILALSMLMAAPGGNEADNNTCPAVTGAVVEVASGGFWREHDRRGRLRLIVEEVGWEHLGSRVWLEWIWEVGDEQRLRVVARKEILELPADLRYSNIRIRPSKQGNIVTLVGRPSTGPSRRFTLTANAPGTYFEGQRGRRGVAP